MSYRAAIVGFIGAAIFFTYGLLNAKENEDTMKVLNMKSSIGEGANKQVDVLFDGPRRKIVQIILRKNGILASHKANEPITIQCISGKGKLFVGENRTMIELSASVLVTIEPNIIHEITSEPEVSILLSKFTE